MQNVRSNQQLVVMSDFRDADIVRRPPFDTVTIAFHWATALIVFAMFMTAWLHSQAHDPGLKSMLLQTHRSLGITVWSATVARLAWRLTNAQFPPFPVRMRKHHRRVVQASEYGLYALLLIQPITGLSDTILRGRAFNIFFWRIPPLMLPEPALRYAFEMAHLYGAYAFGLLVGGHAAAALIHHFLLRDDVLQCMAPVITVNRREQEYLSTGVLPNQQR